MAEDNPRYHPHDELKLPPPASVWMGGDAEPDKLAGESKVALPQVAKVHLGIGGKGSEMTGSFGQEETDFGPFATRKKRAGPVSSRTEGGKVGPMSGERSGEAEDTAALLQVYRVQIKKLEGELQHYKLRVAGVAALVDMLNEKKEEAIQWKEKSEGLETALSRMEHKAGKLERELRNRSAGSEESGRRMPVLPPNRQILNKLARENAQLKMALNRLMGKGIYSYQEGLVSRALLLLALTVQE